MKFISDDLRKDIDLRISSIRDHMRAEGMDAILIASNSNIYYTTGRFFRGYVYIPLDGEPLWFLIKPDVYEEEEDLIKSESRKTFRLP